MVTNQTQLIQWLNWLIFLGFRIEQAYVPNSQWFQWPGAPFLYLYYSYCRPHPFRQREENRQEVAEPLLKYLNLEMVHTIHLLIPFFFFLEMPTLNDKGGGTGCLEVHPIWRDCIFGWAISSLFMSDTWKTFFSKFMKLALKILQ